ncbi:Uncharacterised protein [Bergeyella zoohelcum]|uniref:Uncharacterized protein n=1 Tax=Bergeyella zoohelcum TaxID=1015 RepID=A0A7Z8YN38_9FLAO|nr:Uncharacterised protein [Bergeyella zoohelcum]
MSFAQSSENMSIKILKSSNFIKQTFTIKIYFSEYQYFGYFVIKNIKKSGIKIW